MDLLQSGLIFRRNEVPGGLDASGATTDNRRDKTQIRGEAGAHSLTATLEIIEGSRMGAGGTR